jgi:hypothetical protein
MSELILPNDKDPLTQGKDCPDFIPLDDGTRTGEPKYCNRSFDCRQIGMKSDFVEITDLQTGDVKETDYLCQGILFKRGEMELDEEAH